MHCGQHSLFVVSNASAADLAETPSPKKIDFAQEFSEHDLKLVEGLCRYLLTESPYHHKTASIGYKRTQALSRAVVEYRDKAIPASVLRSLLKTDLTPGRLIRLCSDIPDEKYKSTADDIHETRRRVLEPTSRVFHF